MKEELYSYLDQYTHQLTQGELIKIDREIGQGKYRYVTELEKELINKYRVNTGDKFIRYKIKEE